MTESLAFNNYWDIGFSKSLLYAPFEKTYHSVKEVSAPYIVASGTATTVEAWLQDMDRLYNEFQELITRTKERSELDIPDIFTLRPLATQEITLQITEIKPARFYYVPDIDDE
ncbi:MAG: hypothetical protein M1282_00685 [Chloroflexi bacterium]|nr:hypothetical protein [Chloroflexota bacterium]